DLINTTLILYADHELNASAFTARCAASTGATPYAAVNAGLSALSGPKHGAASQNIEALFREIESQEDVRSALIDRLKRGESLYGFGHAIYTDVDPRARLLFDQIQKVYPDSPHVALTRILIEETHRLKSFRYNIDLPLVTLARILNFPPGRTLALFALGRTVGWIGHILEQYKTNRLIRPRAHYVGVQPT
ncbi:MAG: citrate synthase, partial [bacterium]|nr:citrate synthase [bacterium]